MESSSSHGSRHSASASPCVDPVAASGFLDWVREASTGICELQSSWLVWPPTVVIAALQAHDWLNQHESTVPCFEQMKNTNRSRENGSRIAYEGSKLQAVPYGKLFQSMPTNAIPRNGNRAALFDAQTRLNYIHASRRPIVLPHFDTLSFSAALV